MNTTVIVSPVQRAASQGRDRQSFTAIDPKTKQLVTHSRPLNKTREVGTSVKLKFPLDPLNNRYVTGLDELIENPFNGLEVSDVLSRFNLSAAWQSPLEKIVKQSSISKQTLFEIQDCVPPDHYTSQAKNGTMLNFMPAQLEKREPTFIEQFSIELFDYPNRFTSDTARQRMAIQLIRVHNRIAASKHEANPAQHLFYISEENEAENERMRKQDIIDVATYKKVELQTKASEFTNYKVACLCTSHQGIAIIQGDATRDSVKQAFNNYLNDSKYQIENISKFNKIVDLLDTPEGRNRLDAMFLIQQAINKLVLSVKDGYIIWNSKSDVKNMYKHSNYERFVNLILSEMLIYNPEDLEVTNWYGELYKEVKQKNARLE